jgi:hypothetical protein
MADSKVAAAVVTLNDDNLGNLVEAFKQLVLNKLRASHVLINCNSLKTVSDKKFQIYELENGKECQKANEVLLDAIRKSEEPGKWRMFLDAVKTCGDTVISDILLEEGERSGDTPWLNDSVNSKLIDLYESVITEKMNLDDLLPDMKAADLVSDQDAQRLGAMLNQGKKLDANRHLLFIMGRHNKDWYNIFMEILFKHETHQGLVDVIDHEKFQKLEKKFRSPGAVAADAAAAADDDADTSAMDVDDKRDDEDNDDSVEGDTEPASAGVKVPKSRSVGCTCACKEELSNMRKEVVSLKSEVMEMKNLLLKLLKNESTRADSLTE